ncbi:hypothetical protein ACPV5L_01555 [Vibrio astriarenae]
MYLDKSRLPMLTILLTLFALIGRAEATVYKYEVIDRNGFAITQQSLYIELKEQSLKKFYPNVNMLEVWEVGNNDTLTKTRYFLDDSKAVFYGFSDLRLLGEASYWYQLDPLFDIRIRNFFTERELLGANSEKAFGQIGDIRVEMEQEINATLPDKLVFKQGTRYTEYQLVESDGAEEFNINSGDFALYDFADLSDMLHDSFVIKSFEQGLLERRDVSINHSDNQYMIHWH